MDIRFTYRHVDSSASLSQYAQTQLSEVAAMILSTSRWQVYFSMGRYDYSVEIHSNGPWGHFKASGSAPDFYLAVDMAVEKISRQVQKRKEQLQYHKHPERSKLGQLDNLNEMLEFEPSILSRRSA